MHATVLPSVLGAAHPAVPDVGALMGALIPEMVLTAGILVLLVWESLKGVPGRWAPRFSLLVTMIVFGIVAAQTVPLDDPPTAFGPLLVDGLAGLFRIFFLASAGLALLFAMQRSEPWFEQAEFHILLLASLLGMCVLSASVDILTALLAFEMVSYTGYMMVGYRKNNRMASEAGLKYVIFGSVASGAMLYGLSLLFGLAGTTSMAGIADALSVQGPSAAAICAAVLVFAGIGFKVSAVPFHFWAPDAYHGAPTPVAAFLATASKAAGFVILIRVLGMYGGTVAAVPAGTEFAFLPPGPLPYWLVGVAAVGTMIVGNTAALRQTDLRRLLAWSSVAHAGYMLMALSAGGADAIGGVMYYFWIYLLMTMAGFGIIGLMRDKVGGFAVSDYAGLVKRQPVLAFLLALLMISLTGLPPTLGFWGKVALFAPVIKGGWYGLAVVGLLTSAISLFYYAALIRSMFLNEPAEGAGPIELERSDWVLVLITTAPLLIAGLWGGGLPHFRLVEAATQWLEAAVR